MKLLEVSLSRYKHAEVHFVVLILLIATADKRIFNLIFMQGTIRSGLKQGEIATVVAYDHYMYMFQSSFDLRPIERYGRETSASQLLATQVLIPSIRRSFRTSCFVTNNLSDPSSPVLAGFSSKSTKSLTLAFSHTPSLFVQKTRLIPTESM